MEHHAKQVPDKRRMRPADQHEHEIGQRAVVPVRMVKIDMAGKNVLYDRAKRRRKRFEVPKVIGGIPAGQNRRIGNKCDSKQKEVGYQVIFY